MRENVKWIRCFYFQRLNLSRRGHQVIQIIEKDGFSLTPPLLKTGGGVKKTVLKVFLS